MKAHIVTQVQETKRPSRTPANMVAILKEGMKIIKQIIDILNVFMWGGKGQKLVTQRDSHWMVIFYSTCRTLRVCHSSQRAVMRAS